MTTIKVNGYWLRNAHTYKDATAVEFWRYIPTPQPNVVRDERIVFIDKNNNGMLDAYDVAVKERTTIRPGKGKIVGHTVTARLKITPGMIALYGGDVNAVIRHVRQDRRKMKTGLPAQQRGFCGIVRNQNLRGQPRIFSSPLNIYTRREKRQLHYTLQQLKTRNTVDPRRCELVTAGFFWRVAVHGQPRSAPPSHMTMVGMGYGQQMSAPTRSGLSAYGLVNNLDLIDISYPNDSYHVTHVDIAKK